jgi:radical SAM protein with 4Fe4S-binding SPASM domain
MGILHRVLGGLGPRARQLEAKLLGRLGWQRPPLAVQWMMTRACDLTCDHCYSHAGARQEGELTTEEAKRLLIDPLAAMGCPSLVLAGGEPLLRKDFEELVRYAAHKGVAWSLHAHGRLIPKLKGLLTDIPPQMAAISLDGPPAVHDTLRGREGAFHDALRAMEVLKETGCREVIAGTTVNAINADYVAQMLPLVMASAADGWGLHLFAPEGRGDANRVMFPSAAQLRRVTAFARRARQVFPVEVDNEWGGASGEDFYYRNQAFSCSAGRSSCVVGPTGEVMPCTTTDASESYGNVRARSLIDIWQDGFQKFRRVGGCHDGSECWLQARNDNPCRRPSFDDDAARAAQQEVWL